MKLKTIVCLFVFVLFVVCCQTPAAEPSGKGVPYNACVDSLFRQAAARQQAQDFMEAIRLYKQLLAQEPPSSAVGQETGVVVREAMMQLMYCYFFSGQPGSAVDYYMSLYADTTCWVVREYPRRTEVCVGYSLYAAARLDEAVAMIGKALARPEEGIPVDELYADYGIAGAVYNQAGNIPEAIRCTERCAAILRTLEDRTDLVNALSNLIYQYQQVGDFDRSLATYEELIALEGVEDNAYHRCIAEVNIINLFEEWGLEEEVAKHLAAARRAAESCGIPEARLRVKNLEAWLLLGEGDARGATLAVDTLATLLTTVDTASIYHIYYRDFRLITRLLNASGAGREEAARAVIRRVNELRVAPFDRLRCDLCYHFGKALEQKNYLPQAIVAYESCIPYIRDNHLLNLQRKVYHALARLCAQRTDYAAATRYYMFFDTASQAFTARRNAGLMSQFRVKYATREKEQANELLRTEVRLQRRTIQYYTVTGIATALLVVLLLIWSVMRHRALRLQHAVDARQHELDLLRQEEAARVIRSQEEKLRQMLREHLEINRQNEELLALLEHNQSEEQLRRLMECLSPRLLTPEEEQRFRQQFTLVYPAFLSSLRKNFPSVSRNEELLVMLIRLRLSSEEAALALGIRRGSVNTARSRLRKKLALSSHESLEEFVLRL